MKEKIKEEIKEIISCLKIAAICAIVLLVIFWFDNSLGTEITQYLNSIDYTVVMNEDGSMIVTETWDINIKNTTTLFKTFTLSSLKYGEITDVSVIDLQTGLEFEEIDEYQYYVDKYKFYALDTSLNEFEIAWGVGSKVTGNKKYQISYTVEDVVTEYKDCQEIYWAFLEEGENEIPAAKVTGSIELPEGVSDLENLKVWAHGDVSGEIQIESNNKVTFECENLGTGAMLEIRVVTEEDLFNVSSSKTKNYNYLEEIVEEETEWAEETNMENELFRKLLIIPLIIYAIILIIDILKIRKAKRELSKIKEKITIHELKYFRDIPREETSTPAEAIYLYKHEKAIPSTEEIQRNAVVATILDLCLKKKISLRKEGKKDIYVKITGTSDGLAWDELKILELLRKVEHENEGEFEISKLSEYAKKHYTTYSDSINGLIKQARDNLDRLGLIDKEKEDEFAKGQKTNILRGIYIFLIVLLIFSYIPMLKYSVIAMFGISMQEMAWKILIALLPLVCVHTYSTKLHNRIYYGLETMTQAGSDEKEQWKGLKNYLQDYSLIKEKEVPELVIWEKYLVFGTAFGIADKVIEQMKANYPEVFMQENWKDDEMAEKYPLIAFIYDPISMGTMNGKHIGGLNESMRSLEKGVDQAYSTMSRAISAHTSSGSSGSGGGGGFSGGGGRWRWPEAGMGGR